MPLRKKPGDGERDLRFLADDDRLDVGDDLPRDLRDSRRGIIFHRRLQDGERDFLAMQHAVRRRQDVLSAGGAGEAFADRRIRDFQLLAAVMANAFGHDWI